LLRHLDADLLGTRGEAAAVPAGGARVGRDCIEGVAHLRPRIFGLVALEVAEHRWNRRGCGRRRCDDRSGGRDGRGRSAARALGPAARLRCRNAVPRPAAAPGTAVLVQVPGGVADPETPAVLTCVLVRGGRLVASRSGMGGAAGARRVSEAAEAV